MLAGQPELIIGFVVATCKGQTKSSVCGEPIVGPGDDPDAGLAIGRWPWSRKGVPP